MSNIIEITSEQEFNQALDTEKPVIVDFWATWCYPCKMLSPILHEFAEEMGDKIRVVKVDVDQNEALCYKYDISSIPALKVFINGELKETSVGLITKARLAEIMIKYM